MYIEKILYKTTDLERLYKELSLDNEEIEKIVDEPTIKEIKKRVPCENHILQYSKRWEFDKKYSEELNSSIFEELDIWIIKSQDDENALESLSISRRSTDREKRYLLRYCCQNLDFCVNKYYLEEGIEEVNGLPLRIRSLNQALEGIYTPILDIQDRAKLKLDCSENVCENLEKLFIKIISGIFNSNLDYIKGDVLEHLGKDHLVQIKGMDFPIVLEELILIEIKKFVERYLKEKC